MLDAGLRNLDVAAVDPADGAALAQERGRRDAGDFCQRAAAAAAAAELTAFDPATAAGTAAQERARLVCAITRTILVRLS